MITGMRQSRRNRPPRPVYLKGLIDRYGACWPIGRRTTWIG